MVNLNEYLVPFGFETSVAVRHANDRHIGSLSQEQSVAVEKDPFNIVHHGRLYKKLPAVIKDSENINQFKKRLKTYLFGEPCDMNQKTINEQYKV